LTGLPAHSKAEGSRSARRPVNGRIRDRVQLRGCPHADRCGVVIERWPALCRGASAILRPVGGTRSKLLAFQDRAVARLLAHAGRHVPFYRRLLGDASVRVEEIRSAADLARLPVTTKDAIRSVPPADLLDERVDPARLVSISTTGSTGRPFRIMNSWLEYRILHAFRLRAHRQFGRRLGDRFAEIDQPIARHSNDRKSIGNLIRAARLESRIQLSLYDPPDALLEALDGFAPDIVTSYPGVLLRLGRELRRAPRSRVMPRFLITNSEVLPSRARMEIADTWRCPVFEFYDCHECNLIAWECPAGHGLHCNEDVAVVEVLRHGRPAEVGQAGEVAITSLHSYAMPLIRFALGDVAVRGPTPCPCGQPFATLLAVEGRMVDFFRLPHGRWLHPYRLIENLDRDGTHWVRQYRLIQEREDRIVFQVVPAAGFTPERLAAFVRYASEAVGPAVEIEARLVDDLEPGPGGKFRPARSLIGGDHKAPDWDLVAQ
jgi:phenylacetate-CoA ligase